MTAQPATLPPRDAVVAARPLGSLAVAVARTPGRAIVTILGPDGTGASNRNVRVDGQRATPCGIGCYTTSASDHPVVRIQVGGASTTIRAPVDAPDATAQLARITHGTPHRVATGQELGYEAATDVARGTGDEDVERHEASLSSPARAP